MSNSKSHDARIDELCESINDAICEHMEKEKITYAAVIGALDIVKFDLLNEMKGK